MNAISLAPDVCPTCEYQKRLCRCASPAGAHTRAATALKVKLHYHLENGDQLTIANLARIVARATKPTDRWGNALDENGRSPIDKLRGEPPYFCEWRIKKDHKGQKGYSFQEVGSGHGICGAHKRIRDLVARTLMLGIKVEVEPEAAATARRPMSSMTRVAVQGLVTWLVRDKYATAKNAEALHAELLLLKYLGHPSTFVREAMQVWAETTPRGQRVLNEVRTSAPTPKPRRGRPPTKGKGAGK